MQKYWAILLLFACSTTVVLLGQPVYCIDADNGQTAKQDETSTSTLTEATVKSKKVTLLVRINTPHNKRAIDSCRVYPYPVAPPHRKGKIDKLSIADAALRDQLRTMGYLATSRNDRPYPSGGWRMQYAFKNALAKSGLGEPHTVFTMYAWLDEIVPYMRKEVIRINAIEQQREKLYQAAQQMFDEHRADLEVQAFNDGLFPHDVPLHPWHGDRTLGRVELEKTNWWIVAFHKIPGLKYYWLWPIKLSDAPEQLIELNEDNAIHIEGSW